MTETEDWGHLTLTELAAAKFLCDGCSTETISERLGVAATTADAIIDDVLRKVNASSRVDLVMRWIKRGVI